MQSMSMSFPQNGHMLKGAIHRFAMTFNFSHGYQVTDILLANILIVVNKHSIVTLSEYAALRLRVLSCGNSGCSWD